MKVRTLALVTLMVVGIVACDKMSSPVEPRSMGPANTAYDVGPGPGIGGVTPTPTPTPPCYAPGYYGPGIGNVGPCATPTPAPQPTLPYITPTPITPGPGIG